MMTNLRHVTTMPPLMNLRQFDGEPNTNVTTDPGLSDEMKTYYSAYLLDNARGKLVHDQFGQEHPIPKNRGKTIEFRRFDPLPPALTPLVEGVTPDGRKLTMSGTTATVSQYGDYTVISDVLNLTAIDNTLVQATQAMGSQAGETLDIVTREVLVGGTNVQYAEGQVTARNQLVGGAASGNHYLTVEAIRQAVRFLKTQNAPQIDGSYVAIIHPDCSYHLRKDAEWQRPHEYVDTAELYSGEIGKIEGVRFVETTFAKKWAKAGANEADVYATLVLGQNAYGKTALEGGGLSHIFKPLGSAGAADPLDQRQSVGWKATKVAKRLTEQFMIRIETATRFNDGVAN